MRILALCVVALCACFAVVSCGQRLDPAPAAPTTSWTTSDSATVATVLMASAVKNAWSSEWRAKHQDRIPSVSITTIEDRSGDNIPVDALAQAFAQQLMKAEEQRLMVVGDGTGTVLLSGVITMKTEGRTKYFSLDLALKDAATGALLWQGPYEHPIVAQ